MLKYISIFNINELTRKQDYDKNDVNIYVDIDINQTIYNNCITIVKQMRNHVSGAIIET